MHTNATGWNRWHIRITLPSRIEGKAQRRHKFPQRIDTRPVLPACVRSRFTSDHPR